MSLPAKCLFASWSSALIQLSFLPFHNLSDSFGWRMMPLGPVLVQKQNDGLVKHVAFFQSYSPPTWKNYGSTEMEALGVVGSEAFLPLLDLCWSSSFEIVVKHTTPFRHIGKMGASVSGSGPGDQLLSRPSEPKCGYLIRRAFVGGHWC